MLYHTILYYSILYYTVLYYTVLYYTTLRYGTAQYDTIPELLVNLHHTSTQLPQTISYFSTVLSYPIYYTLVDARVSNTASPQGY